MMQSSNITAKTILHLPLSLVITAFATSVYQALSCIHAHAQLPAARASNRCGRPGQRRAARARSSAEAVALDGAGRRGYWPGHERRPSRPDGRRQGRGGGRGVTRGASLGRISGATAHRAPPGRPLKPRRYITLISRR